ncbi:sulfatase-like hydrolase/transferase [Thiolapillus brandeum]|uniref:SLH domain-containing protein n=1 Tax=Thiolapillus brandeum TaxID=1076588 RepID=A0A7U6GG31_9GAMM|nr:sulfatase-like hydrolase/transferase [Thiolapillus brandeum]BAO42980.1 hypothetical protein TBH_C0030 [Thiolapillus brandeum]
MTNPTHQAAMSRSILHIFIFATFAIAQPVFDLLSHYPEFFIARHTAPADIWLLMAFLSLGVPALLILCLLPLRLFGMRLWTMAANTAIFLLFAVIVWRSLRLMETGIQESLLLGIAGTATLAFAWFYLRQDKLREFISFLAPAVIIFPLLLAFYSPVNKILFPSRAENTPGGQFTTAANRNVVVLVFDEFPLFSLLRDDETIDPEMFPSFHTLSRSADWYQYATAVADSTLRSLTSIITGHYPGNDKVWTYTSYPNNLFTLYAGTHDIQAYESATDFCPNRVCGNEHTPEPDKDNLKKLITDLGIVYAHMVTPDALKDPYLPPLGATWKDFGAQWQDEVKSTTGKATAALKNKTLNKVQAATRGDSALRNYMNWLEKIRQPSQPGIWFHHIQLPHKPWKYYPDGIRYYPGGIEGLKDEFWTSETGLVLHGYQRHLLQVAYADHLLGLLLDKLREQGLYDDALIIVTADHGASFMPGRNRRILGDKNFADILRVPLFIKWPRQKTGRTRDDDAELVDLLPTINRALGTGAHLALDGRALTSRGRVERERRVVLERTKDNRLKRRLYASKELKANRGSLDEKVRFLNTIYAVGGFDLLLGEDPAGYLASRRAQLSFTLDYPGLLNEVDLSKTLLPGRILGSIQGWTQPGELPYVALALNGKIRATAKLYRGKKGRIKFSTMVPHSALEPGNNRISLYLIENPSQGKPLLLEMDHRASRSRWKPIDSAQNHYFRDVQNWNAVSKSIYALANQGITGGCKPGLFCPNTPISRAAAAVFLGKAMQGVNYQPPAAHSGRFRDITNAPGAGWIELLAGTGIISGCNNHMFCPDQNIDRSLFSQWLLKARYGADHVPPADDTRPFQDVPMGSPQARWIQQIARDGITAGCGANTFCPEKPVTRADAAVWLVRAFKIPSAE